jgi:phosphatidylserine/phosphatidylglycerophosphate/cardiolipin synthase-like enzyme
MDRHAEHIPFTNAGSYPIRAGNTARPLVDGVPAFRRICEAIEAAEHSVWATVAFYQAAFRFPDARGTLFDVLDRAAERGLDVRVIFWRHVELERIDPGTHFPGTTDERAMLRERGSRFRARWDRAHGAYCQHQKSWLIDAGKPSEVAFVGGINLNSGSVVTPGHPPTERGNTHDVYVEVSGPSATDVHHNFVQRWNESSDRDAPDGSWPDGMSLGQLAFPERLSQERGECIIQVQRTVRRGHYTDGTPVPGGNAFAIEGGEFSIADQYVRAIDSAQRTVYLEDQAIGSPQVVDALSRALQRDVHVAFVVPIDANAEMARARRNPATASFFESVAALGQFPHFTLAGLATRRDSGDYQNVYVHAKVALIDDGWCTIGSANVANRSFYGDTELNASIWHGPTVHALRCALIEEHTGRDTRTLGDVAALGLFADVARGNAARRSGGGHQDGLALALDPATYAS